MTSLKKNEVLQKRALKVLFDTGQYVFVQPGCVGKFPPQRCPIKEYTSYQLVSINPASGPDVERNKGNILQFQSICIEQDCISLDLQEKWFRCFFPDGATVEVFSGVKSIHNIVRFDPVPEEGKILEIIKAVKKSFPFCDFGVLGNKSGLTRMPAGIRGENKHIQDVLHIGERYDPEDFFLRMESCKDARINPSKARRSMNHLFRGENLDNMHLVKDGLVELLCFGYDISEGSLILEAYKENFEKNSIPFSVLESLIEKAEKEKESAKKKITEIDSPRKISSGLKGKLNECNLVDVLIAHCGLDISGIRHREGGKKIIRCPFHEDKTASAWISRSPSGVEYFFCSSDMCKYSIHSASNGRKGLHAVDILIKEKSMSYKEASNSLWPRYEDHDEHIHEIIDDEEFLDDEPDKWLEEMKAKVPPTPAPQNEMVYDVAKKLLDDHEKNVQKDMGENFPRFYQQFLLEAAQASGKSHTAAKIAHDRYISGSTTIYVTRSHDELKQMKRRIELMFRESRLDPSHIIHLKGAKNYSSDDEEHVSNGSYNLPAHRPLIILTSHTYFTRRGHTLYHYPIIEDILHKNFGDDLLVIIDEAASYINSMFVSIPLGGRMSLRVDHGKYERNVRNTKCPLYTKSGSCSNCFSHKQVTYRIQRGVLTYTPIGTHKNGDVLQYEESPHINIYDEIKVPVNTMIMYMADSRRKELRDRIWSRGGKEDIQLEPSFSSYIDDLMMTLISPHIIEFYPYDINKRENLGRPLTDEELEARSKGRLSHIVPPAQICGTEFLQGWDALILEGIKNKCDTLFLSPDLSDQHRMFMSIMYGGIECP